MNTAEVMDFPLEGLHEETGPGVFEGAIVVDDILSAGDKAALFKTSTKITAQQHKAMACFMAKWSNDWPGQSGHLHISLTDLEGKSAFYDADAEHNMSKTMRHFVAGCQKMLPEVLCMVAPTINSFLVWFLGLGHQQMPHGDLKIVPVRFVLFLVLQRHSEWSIVMCCRCESIYCSFGCSRFWLIWD